MATNAQIWHIIACIRRRSMNSSKIIANYTHRFHLDISSNTLSTLTNTNLANAKLVPKRVESDGEEEYVKI